MKWASLISIVSLFLMTSLVVIGNSSGSFVEGSYGIQTYENIQKGDFPEMILQSNGNMTLVSTEFVAGDYEIVVSVSEDGATWEETARIETEKVNELTLIELKNGSLVLIQNDELFLSPDARDWSFKKSVPGIGAGDSVITSEGDHIIKRAEEVYLSDNGIDWEIKDMVFDLDPKETTREDGKKIDRAQMIKTTSNIIEMDDHYIMYTHENFPTTVKESIPEDKIMTSKDCITWEVLDVYESGKYHSQIFYGGTYVSIGLGYVGQNFGDTEEEPFVGISFSADGLTWTNSIQLTQDKDFYTPSALRTEKGRYYIAIADRGGDVDIITFNEKDIPQSYAPTIRFTSPENGVVRGTIDIKWEAFDPESEELTIDITRSINMKEGETLLSRETISKGEANDGSYEWDTTKVPDGEYTIYVIANDGSGYSSEDSVTIEVINNPIDKSPSPFFAMGLIAIIVCFFIATKKK